jgi:glycopeptide antibiotics resistance protein
LAERVGLEPSATHFANSPAILRLYEEDTIPFVLFSLFGPTKRRSHCERIQRSHKVKSLSKILLVFYLLILLWLVLFKFSLNVSSVFDYQMRSLNLIPFADSSRDDLREMIYNCVVFIPFGLLLSVNLKRATFWRRLAFVCIFSLAAEMIQFVFAIGITDITDVITNTFGGFLGLILYDVSNRYVDNEKLDRFIVVAGTILLIVFILLLGILFSMNVRYHSAK